MSDFATHTLTQLMGISYDNGNEGTEFLIPLGFAFVDSQSSLGNGYNGASFYHSETNTLVVSSAGTNILNPVDLYQDLVLALGGMPI